MSPLSDGGKIFCVVYAVCGIPLTLILFTALVERLMILTTLMYGALQASDNILLMIKVSSLLLSFSNTKIILF